MRTTGRPKGLRRLAVDAVAGARPRAGIAALFVLLLPALASGQPPLDTPDLERIERAFGEVAQQMAPAVVGIRARRQYTDIAPVAGDEPALEAARLVLINGSGTIISDEGHILTNEHVVRGAESIEVVYHTGRVVPAVVVGADARSDLAVLSAARGAPRVARRGDWASVRQGQWTLVLGNPFGLAGDGRASLSVGVIANLHRRLPGLGEADDRLYDDMIQTTAPIHPGNSGGPVFNIRGELLGVVTAMHVRSVDDEGAGFAIPLSPENWARVERLMRGERVDYGYLGLSVRAPAPGEVACTQEGGAAIDRIEPSGPAKDAGLRPGDVIIRYDGAAVVAPEDLVRLVGRTPVGTLANVAFCRGGAVLSVLIRIEQRQVSTVSWMRDAAIYWRGARLADLDEVSQRLTRAAPGRGVVIIDVADDSPAARARLRVGAIITTADGILTEDTRSFRQAVSARRGAVRVRLQDGSELQVAPD